jgi:tetratricopeptide (TPR) repeat protein
MKTLRSMLAGMTLIVGLGLASNLAPGPALAVDNIESTDAPDLTSVLAKIKAKDYAGALAELRDLAEDTQQADVYNLLGFTLRKTGYFKTSLTYYTKALELKPDHKAAREIPWRALRRNRRHREGQGTAFRPSETLSWRLRRARRPSKGNQREIGKQVNVKAGDHSPASSFELRPRE